MNPVEIFLRSEIGLDVASVGDAAIERATRLRMKSLGLKKPEDYHRLLVSSPAEREELVESVVVTETWFFRDYNSFTAFTQLAQEWFSRNPGSLRALSVPCSTGEEPYSIAMCLLDMRIPPERFVIDAIDLSARALARARQAQYGKNSFRGKDLAFRKRHFQQIKNLYELNASVRNCVHFQRDNLLNDKFLSDCGPYHFIFCRNVLIYFDRPTQSAVLRMLRAKLTADGVLFVGPAELPIVLSNDFASLNFPMAFACRRHEHSPITSPAQHRVRTLKQAAPPSRSSAANSRIQSPPVANSQPVATPTPDLQKAQELADEGSLKEATEICEAYVRQRGQSPQAYYLLGLVLDASGDTRAADYYRKALYLEPNHYESLWHMALLMEKIGNAKEAQAYRRRAERARKRT